MTDDDLLRRLRLEWHASGRWPAIDVMEAAADEIESLRARLAECERERDRLEAALRQVAAGIQWSDPRMCEFANAALAAQGKAPCA